MSNIFASAIATDEPIDLFERKNGETGVPNGVSNDLPLQTNSFYSNLLVENQDCAVWTHPYSVWNNKKDKRFGLGLYLARTSDRVFGEGDPAEYFTHPVGEQKLVLSSSDFKEEPEFSLRDLSKFAATARFSSKSEKDCHLDCPLVQGMGFVTGVYSNCIPKISSSIGFKSIDGDKSPRLGTNKYKIELEDGTQWFLYVTLSNEDSVKLALKGKNDIIAEKSVDGVFQLCFASDVDSKHYDSAAGCYAKNASIEASVDGDKCSYSLKLNTEGKLNSNSALFFALPHHVAAFDSDTKNKATSLKLPTTTKGEAVGVLLNKITMEEKLTMKDVAWDPATTIEGKKANFSDNALKAIKAAAQEEADKDVSTELDGDSMYFSGKILAKYAIVLSVCHNVLKDDGLTDKLLQKMKDALDRFKSNKQKYPLFYDTAFKGIVSLATENEDFGNGHYNDHHFHWGYHIQAAAITAFVDQERGGKWTDEVKPWVTSLVRDIANPSSDDKHFPVFRAFDFYNGHSWAKGLYASADGKDEESSSEDYNHAYALKLWGKVVKDENIERRADLMLAIMSRSMNSYFLMADDNKVQPLEFIGNKVTGILFENKAHHTTYFGTNEEYIQGIHMIPISPVSSFIRKPEFVKQEWEQKLKSLVGDLDDGWRGILMLNAALFDPDTAWKFFSSSDFNKKHLDDGQSKTWSLAYCAGVGASS
ncbi:hypothetical protein C7M61_000122 [Candidozyma pseudohaemuli]|uniref:glucan endo-1,3-beta-D-glucosidase n=1 Tax=Candidozyma pseudohaemuli TaxID=418784 RepID=A0A2P7YX00_9ASCO|nr:hypothetical protein C7M61_000122 [[Candida] pseudohaemulonii]PSK40480.1 hypothetical protein C7M61_000122 [[Candida] pseudohaemulonii]